MGRAAGILVLSSHAGWAARFATTFVVAFLASGLLYGILYVLVMRAIRLNREDVEAWFERQRQRLLSGPVPVIETMHPVMLSALYAVYGRDVGRRLATSFCIGLLFSGVVFGVLYYDYRHVSVSVRETKATLERNADPFLYKYATMPELASDYQKALEKTYIPPRDDRSIGAWIPTYHDPLSVQIRTARDEYDSHFLAVVSLNADRLSITILRLFEGDHISPGFRIWDSTVLFLFNVLLDFMSITIVIELLRWLGRDLSFGRAVLSFFIAGAGTVICCLTSFLSYSMFLRGNPRFFAQLLGWMPLSLAAMGVSVCLFGVFVYAVVLKILRGSSPIVFFANLVGESPADLDWPDRLMFWALPVYAAGFGVAGIYGVRAIWGDWRYGLHGGIPWHDFPHPPYILALTTFIPAALASLGFGLMLVGKLLAEPSRVVPEAYMTFVKEEVGGTQASGIIALLGLITGAIAGLIGASG